MLDPLLRTAAAAMQDGVMLLDGRGAVVYVNPRAEQILGRPAAELVVGSSYDPRWSAVREDGTPFLKRDHPGPVAIRTGESCRDVVMGVSRPDGSLVWISASAGALSSPSNGMPDGAVVTFRDITGERDSNRVRAEFVSQVSHELRTPLTSIKGYIELMLEDRRLTDEQRRSLQVVQQNTERSVALISDLLDLSRIETGGLRLALDAVNVRAVVREVVAVLQPLLDAKRQEISIDIPDSVRSAWGDPRRVGQVVTNLLSNAHKYTPLGGEIRVTARGEPGCVRVDVQDSGIGISADDQKQLFRKFFRASNRVTREAGGTGLGLALSRSLVELQGGQMTCESEPGRGSTFTFTLPVPPPLQQRLRHVDW